MLNYEWIGQYREHYAKCDYCNISHTCMVGWLLIDKSLRTNYHHLSLLHIRFPKNGIKEIKECLSVIA